MKRIAFFDLKDQPVIYVMEKNGGDFVLRETVPVIAKDTGAYGVEGALGHVDETYLSLPLAYLNFRILELPFSDMGKIREVLPFELDGLILGGSEKIVFDACILEEGKESHKVLAVYVRKDLLKAVLDGLKAMGIDAKVVTSVEMALALGSFSSGDGITKLALDQGRQQGSKEERVRAAAKEVQTPAINLRRGDFAYTGDDRKKKKALRVTQVLALLLCAVFLSDASLKIVSAKRESSVIKEEIGRSYANVFPNEGKAADELYQLRAHLKELKDKQGAFSGMAPLQTLLGLSSAGGQGIVFTEVIIDKDRIIIKGECPSLADAQRLKGNLDRFLTGVGITDTRISAQNRMAFTITAKGEKI